MKNKRQSREKKLRERSKRRDAYQKLIDERKAYAEKYPAFTFINEDRADPSLVSRVREICDAVNFDSFEPFLRDWYIKIKKDQQFLEDFFNYEGGTHPAVLAHMFHMGDYIYKNLGANIGNWIPYNDIRALPTGKQIRIEFNGLCRGRVSGGSIYYSYGKPKVRFGETEYVVGFTTHAIQQTMSRLSARPNSYAGSGDVFAYLDQCRYYEPVILNNGEPAFSIWDQCSRGFFSWNFVQMAYGIEAQGNNYYRRVGYCPVVLDSGYAKAKTLLPPGFRNTPEEKLLFRLGTAERATMRSVVEKSIAECVDLKRGMFQVPTNYLDAIKFFHSLHPQVMQTDKKIYERG